MVTFKVLLLYCFLLQQNKNKKPNKIKWTFHCPYILWFGLWLKMKSVPIFRALFWSNAEVKTLLYQCIGCIGYLQTVFFGLFSFASFNLIEQQFCITLCILVWLHNIQRTHGTPNVIKSYQTRYRFVFRMRDGNKFEFFQLSYSNCCTIFGP